MIPEFRVPECPECHSPHDSWEPCNEDEFATGDALVAYWELANATGQSQDLLVSDPWRLWRLARDLAEHVAQDDAV